MLLFSKEIAIHSLICFSFHGQFQSSRMLSEGIKKSLNITTQDLKPLQSRLYKLDICQPDRSSQNCAKLVCFLWSSFKLIHAGIGSKELC